MWGGAGGLFLRQRHTPNQSPCRELEAGECIGAQTDDAAA